MTTRLMGAAALAMTLALAGCGGSDSSGTGSSSDGPSAGATPSATTEAPAERTGTYAITGDVEASGDLSSISCVPSDGGTQVTGDLADGLGNLTVVSGPGPEGSERRDSVLLKGADGTIYNRGDADDLPFDVADDGGTVSGTVALVDLQDITKPLAERHQILLRVDVDCG